MDRRAFHEILREWWLRGGATVGDPARFSGRAWLGVNDGFDWYYLSADATAASVRTYLDLVLQHGGEIAWLEDRTVPFGPRLVNFGPDAVRIPGFPLHVWRN